MGGVPASSTRLQQSEPRETGNPWHLNLMSGQRVAGKMRLVYNQDSQPGACQQHSGSSSCDAGSHNDDIKGHINLRNFVGAVRPAFRIAVT